VTGPRSYHPPERRQIRDRPDRDRVLRSRGQVLPHAQSRPLRVLGQRLSDPFAAGRGHRA